MPCNIGFKSYEPIKIPEPQPQVFKTEASAPEIDADLLKKLGEEDPEFLDWVSTLDPRSLLEEALKRTRSKTNGSGIRFKIGEDGTLKAEGSFTSQTEKRRLSEAAKVVSERWQFELLGIVVELLDYDVTIREEGGGLVLEAEEKGKSHPCDFIKVTKKGDSATLTFEHFKTRKALEKEIAKFLSLADRLGVKIALEHPSVTEGDPFPDEVRETSAHHNHHHTH